MKLTREMLDTAGWCDEHLKNFRRLVNQEIENYFYGKEGYNLELITSTIKNYSDAVSNILIEELEKIK